MDINDISAFLDTLGKGLTIKVTVVRKFKIVRMMHFFYLLIVREVAF